MNGKGDKLRKGANVRAYWDNYDNIFQKKPRKTVAQWVKHLNLVPENYDGFREYNSDDLITEDEFNKNLKHASRD